MAMKMVVQCVRVNRDSRASGYIWFSGIFIKLFKHFPLALSVIIARNWRPTETIFFN